MASPVQRTRLPGPVSALAWNADCSSVAVSHGGSDGDICIYQAASTHGGVLSWKNVATLSGHQQLVSGLDWSPRGGQILSCSHDRNAFVWTRDGGDRSAAAASTSGSGSGGWEKQMVITRLTKGALCVRWSPSEAKFAIGSAAKNVCVGYFDPESKWWACKLIRKAHESSVVSVAWHPNSLLLASGSTDGRVRLFNAYVRGYEPDAPPGSLPEGSFGDCMYELSHEGCSWVHSVVWAGESLLYASHDGVVGTVSGPKAEVAVRLPVGQLPLKCLAVVSERLAVGAGWDGGIVVLTRSGGGTDGKEGSWRQAAVLGGGVSSSGGGSGSGAVGGGIVRQMAAMQFGGSGAAGGATGQAASGSSVSSSGHSALVTGLHVRPPPCSSGPAATAAPSASGGGKGGPCGKDRWHVASAALDGDVLLWDLSEFLK